MEESPPSLEVPEVEILPDDHSCWNEQSLCLTPAGYTLLWEAVRNRDKWVRTVWRMCGPEPEKPAD